MKAIGYTPPKLAERIGELCGHRPSDVAVWGWVNRGRKPFNKKWIKALATIFKVSHGEQFFLSWNVKTANPSWERVQKLLVILWSKCFFGFYFSLSGLFIQSGGFVIESKFVSTVAFLYILKDDIRRNRSQATSTKNPRGTTSGRVSFPVPRDWNWREILGSTDRPVHEKIKKQNEQGRFSVLCEGGMDSYRRALLLPKQWRPEKNVIKKGLQTNLRTPNV